MNSSEIAQLRAETHLSQEKFGALIGVTGAAVSYWESGATAPRPTRETVIRSAAQNYIAFLKQSRKSVTTGGVDFVNRKIGTVRKFSGRKR